MEELSMCRAVYKLHSEDVIWLHGGWRWGGLLPLTQGSSVFVFVPLPVWKLLAVSVPLPSLRSSFGNTGVLHYILLHFIVVFFVVSFSFLNWVCGNSAWSKSAGAIFPTAFAHFLSLHHILVILVIFQTFSWLSCYGNLWSLIFAHFSIVEKNNIHTMKPKNLCYLWYSFYCNGLELNNQHFQGIPV